VEDCSKAWKYAGGGVEVGLETSFFHLQFSLWTITNFNSIHILLTLNSLTHFYVLFLLKMTALVCDILLFFLCVWIAG
jgi:hypothetical protein